MSMVSKLKAATVNSLGILYNQSFTENDFQVNLTKPEFEGDYTVVLFSLLKKTGKSPDMLGQELGEDLLKNNRAQLIWGLVATIVLGMTFLGFQIFEYAHAYSAMNLKMP